MVTRNGKVVNLNSKESPLSLQNCLFVQNTESGRNKINIYCNIQDYFSNASSQAKTTLYDGTQDLDAYENVVVVGGDGTIHHAVNGLHGRNNLVYVPLGTVNDFGKIKRENGRTPILGRANDKRFCYVLATGTFTSIGYQTERAAKKKMGRLAYYAKAMKGLKIERIPLCVCADGKSYKGEYTLAMLLRSPRCFGFKFNRMYNEQKPEIYLLLIASPKRGGILGTAQLFCRFFRAFFMGFSKEKQGAVCFFPCKEVTISAQSSLTYCLDGERFEAPLTLRCVAEVQPFSLSVLKKEDVLKWERRRRKHA